MPRSSYDAAARDTRARLRIRGEADLAQLRRDYPIGSVLIVNHEGYAHIGIVDGHELNSYYKPMVVLDGGSAFYRAEIVRPVSELEATLVLRAALRHGRYITPIEAVTVISDYWEARERAQAEERRAARRQARG